MKIAVNAISMKSGGGITYLSNLLRALVEIDLNNQYLIIVPDRLSVPLPPSGPRCRIKFVKIPFRSTILRILYEQIMIPFLIRKHGVDVLYSPADIASLLAPCPVVLGIQNPNLYTDLKLSWPIAHRVHFAFLRWMALLSLRRADRIIVLTDSFRKELAVSVDLRGKEVAIIPHGINPDFSSRKRENISLESGYLLTVSNLYRYKNVLTVIKAYHRLLSDGSVGGRKLYIVGDSVDSQYQDQIESYITRHKLEDMVLLLGYRPHEEMPGIYGGAALFIFPSYLETFGFPPLEAMASGLPVIAAEIEVTRENLEDAALYFDQFSVGDLMGKITRVFEDSILRERMIEKGRARTATFTWNESARKTLEAFKAAVN